MQELYYKISLRFVTVGGKLTSLVQGILLKAKPTIIFPQIYHHRKARLMLRTIPLSGDPCPQRRAKHGLPCKGRLGRAVLTRVLNKSVAIFVPKCGYTHKFTLRVTSAENTCKLRHVKSRVSDPHLHSVEMFTHFFRYPKPLVCKLRSPIHQGNSPSCTTFSSGPTM